MMYATKINMQSGCAYSNSTLEIAEIYIEGCDNPGFFPKATLHDFVKEHPDSIKVKLSPYPALVPATSTKGEKYVRSEPNDTPNDNLLKLPRV